MTAYANANLDMQGFGALSAEEKGRNALPLRFTPAIGTALVLVGLVLQSPQWLAAMALVALSGALLPAGMLIDVVYNVYVRRLFGAPRLPRTPTPRRFSYVISAALLASSSLAFVLGAPMVGFLLGGLVVIGGAILSTTFWCLGSWIYWMVCSLLPSARLR
jgi:hypothetical protein